MKVSRLLITASVFLLVNILVADPQRINQDQDDLQLFPKVAHPDGGGYIFAWVSNLEPHFEIYARAFDSDLDNGSSEDDISTPSPADGHRLHAEIVSSIKETGQGTDYGAMVAWVDHKSDSVYVTRLSSDASRDFLPKQVHPAAFMTPPEMCSDGAGGLVFASLDSNYQRKLINDRLDRSVLFVWVESKIFDKNLINDIIVDTVLKVYNKPQLNPFVGF